LKLKVLLIAFLLLSVISVVVAVNQLQNEKSIVPNETNGTINQPSNETNTASDALEADATQYPFRLTITLNKTEFTLGETVNITLRLRNIGNETKYLLVGSDVVSYIVYDEANSTVWNEIHHLAFIAARLSIRIDPGEEIVFEKYWKQIDDSYMKVPPGTYHIVGALYCGYYIIKIKTPPITITIVEQE